MQMLRLNVRHQLPQTDFRIKYGQIDKAKYQPAEVHTNLELGKSNQGATQVSVQLDNYPSRKSWGARSDVRANRSRTTQIAWERAENGGKPGDDIKQQIMQEVHAESPETLVQFELMEGPRITVTPSEIVGEPEVGDVTAEIETEPFADVHYTPGIFDMYLKNKGSMKRWVTMNEYDIYA